jgi:hypothetical protein
MNLHLPRPGPVPGHDLKRVRIQYRSAFRKDGIDLFVIDQDHLRVFGFISGKRNQQSHCNQESAKCFGIHLLVLLPPTLKRKNFPNSGQPSQR